MLTAMSHLSVLFGDAERAKDWYTRVLGLETRQDQMYGPGFRWLTVGVPGQTLEVVLHAGTDEAARALVGKTPSPVLQTTDCRADVERIRNAGGQIVSEPEPQMWGIQAIVTDPDGNNWVLVQRPA
jgi:predicted enzyme related to lactoylglutathione lyase